jgi:hypothetical protein
MNRGIARRTIFETRDDVRYFLAGVARAVRRGEIEVHGYSVLTTHFHALVRSPSGQLSEAMRRIENAYVRRFKRLRRRDGPLFRGRFRSKPVDSLTYRRLLVRYIDANPVTAGLAPAPELYPYGSAQCFAKPSGPPWLERSWIEATVEGTTGRTYGHEGYVSVFGGPLPARLRELVAARITRGLRAPDPLDDLASSTAEHVLAWMKRKARLADGTGPGLAVCDQASVAEAIEAGRNRWGAWIVHPGHKPVDAWLQVHAGLLCGRTTGQAASALSRSESGTGRLRARHRRSMLADEEYGARARELAVEALVRCGVRKPSKTVVKMS